MQVVEMHLIVNPRYYETRTTVVLGFSSLLTYVRQFVQEIKFHIWFICRFTKIPRKYSDRKIPFCQLGIILHYSVDSCYMYIWREVTIFKHVKELRENYIHMNLSQFAESLAAHVLDFKFF